MRELTKVVDVGDHQYQINRMTALDGTWVLALTQQGNLPEDRFRSLQLCCLKVCQRFVESVEGRKIAEPVLREDGRLNFPDLETDLPSIHALVNYALAFNLAPFFVNGGMTVVTLEQAFERMNVMLPKSGSTK